MKRAAIVTSLACACLTGCSTGEKSYDSSDSQATSEPLRNESIAPEAVAELARQFGTILELPAYETSAAQIAAAAEFAMNDADRKLDAVGRVTREDATFQNTILALDDINFELGTVSNRFYLMQYTSPDASLRDASREATVEMANWGTETQYREDVYRACKAFEWRLERGDVPALSGAERLLFDDTMLDYRRAGMHLDETTRERVAALQMELTGVMTEFSANNASADVTVMFTRDELAGVPENFLDQWDTGDGSCAVKASVTPQFATVMTNATSEATRQRMKIARYQVNQEANAPLLNEMVRLRDEIGQLLGYSAWADYRTETRMAGSGANAEGFLTDLIAGMEPKFQEEIASFQAMKAEETGDAEAQINIWDWRYYSNKLLRERYSIDTEALRDYFPLESVMRGAFEVYGEVFGLSFMPVEIPDSWDESLTLWLCVDEASGQPMGLMYLDPYPRANKYGHYAQFPIIPGKKLPSGDHVRPVCALVCNFPAPTDDRPSLLAFAEVETYFHELGHALHTMLSTAEHVRYSGTGVPRDFVEAPSQMLENWLSDPGVLNRFAADWRDPSKKVPAQTLKAMKAAELATVATAYRRQMALALGDIRVHKAGRYKDVGTVVNDTFAEVFLPVPEGTNFSAYWGHLAGYDAGYYGYAWADSIAADMATIFENAPGGYMDKEIGKRLRDEIYSVGGSRPINESVEQFLGRERSLDAFLSQLGIK